MLKLIKNISLSSFFCLSFIVSANEIVEVNMESILEVGRENQNFQLLHKIKLIRQKVKLTKLLTNIK